MNSLFQIKILKYWGKNPNTWEKKVNGFRSICVWWAQRGLGERRTDEQRPQISKQLLWYTHHQQSASCVKVVIDFTAEMFLMRSLLGPIKKSFLSFLSPPPTPRFSPATAVHDLHREALLLWQQAANLQGLAVLSERENCCLTHSPIKTWMYQVKNKPRTSLFCFIVIWLAFKSHTLCIWNSSNTSISWAFQHFNQSISQNKKAEMSNSNHPLNSLNPLCYRELKALPRDNFLYKPACRHADALPRGQAPILEHGKAWGGGTGRLPCRHPMLMATLLHPVELIYHTAQQLSHFIKNTGYCVCSWTTLYA